MYVGNQCGRCGYIFGIQHFYCPECGHNAGTMLEQNDVDARISDLQQRLAEAMGVLSPNMPENGLVDACRQVKQVAITQSENCETLEQRLAERQATIDSMQKQWDAETKRYLTTCKQLTTAQEEIKRLNMQQLADVTLSDWGKEHCHEIDRLRNELTAAQAEIERLRQGLRRLQYAPTEDSCEVDGHPCTEDDDEHNNSCCGCGRFKCEGHKPDCWLSKLLEGK